MTATVLSKKGILVEWVNSATRSLVLTVEQAEELREVLRGALQELDSRNDAEVAIEDLMRDARTPLAPFARG